MSLAGLEVDPLLKAHRGERQFKLFMLKTRAQSNLLRIMYG